MKIKSFNEFLCIKLMIATVLSTVEWLSLIFAIVQTVPVSDLMEGTL